jgi:hypothetical protein
MKIPKLPQVLVQTAVIFGIFVLAVIVFIATYRPPEFKPSGTTGANNSVATALPCNHSLTGGLKDSYSYAMLRAGNVTGTISSRFLGKQLKDSGSYYVRETATTSAAGNYKILTYMDENFNCSFQEAEFEASGRTSSQEMPCQIAASESAAVFNVCLDNMVPVGQEDITMMGQTFTATMYSSRDNMTRVWLSQSISLPLKLSNAGLFILEMTSYELGQ